MARAMAKRPILLDVLLIALSFQDVQGQTITAIAPQAAMSVRIGTYDIVLTGSNNAGTAEFIASGGTCTAGAQTYTVAQYVQDAISIVDTDLTTVGTYELCYTPTGGSVQKQSGITLTVSVSDPHVFSAISTQYVGAMTSNIVPSTITLTSNNPAVTGDLMELSTSACSGDLTSSGSAIALTNGATTHTITQLFPPGFYYVCYVTNGNTDSVAQYLSSDYSLIYIEAGYATGGTDPVARFGSTVREFNLPPQVLMPLLKTPDLVVQGLVFEGSPTEQWFERFILSTVDESRWMEIKIKDDLENVNASKFPPGVLQSFEVLLGYGSISNPQVTTRVTDFGFQVPFSFLGSHIVLRPVRRNHNVRFPGIGGFRRECVDIASASMHLYICSAPADEYLGNMRYLALRYAHLDLAVIEAVDFSQLTGLLPELWGTQPMSETTKMFVLETERKEQHEAAPDAAPARAAAWAGGMGMEELGKGCLEQNDTDAILAV